MRRPNPVVKRIDEDRYELVLPAEHRGAVIGLLDELDELLETAPDDPSTRRLHPPAYLDDSERDSGYQLLAGDELRSSRRDAIRGSREALERGTFTGAELWAWLRSLNALRLVVGTRLGIEDDHHEPPEDLDETEAALWDILDFAGEVQFHVIRALSG